MRASCRPKLKSVFPMFEVDGSVYFQGSGQLFDVGEATVELRHLLGLLDGSRDAAAIERDFRDKFPAIEARDIENVITELDQSGILHDESDVGLLTDYELDRWSRNLGFFETYANLSVSKYELQRRVAECRVVVLGVGGIGSHVVYDLAAMGVRNIRLVDFDTIELSNLNRQILYRESDIGGRKVENAARHVLEFNSALNVDVMDYRLGSADDVRIAVAGYDIAIATADRPKMHIAKWLSAGCVAAKVPLITTGIDTQRALYFTIIPGVSGCVECWERQAAGANPVAGRISEQMARMEAEQKPGERFGQDFAAFVPLVSVSAAAVVSELVRIATGIIPPIALNRLMEISFRDFAGKEAETWERLDDCGTCSTASPAEISRPGR